MKKNWIRAGALFLSAVLMMALCVGIFKNDAMAVDFHSLPYIQEITKTAKDNSYYRFQILEIIPEKGSGSIGYYVGGSEPIADLLRAYVDKAESGTTRDGRNDFMNATVVNKLKTLKLLKRSTDDSTSTPLIYYDTQLYTEKYPWEERTDDYREFLLDTQHPERVTIHDMDVVYDPNGAFVVNAQYDPDGDRYRQDVSRFELADPNAEYAAGTYFYRPEFREFTREDSQSGSLPGTNFAVYRNSAQETDSNNPPAYDKFTYYGLYNEVELSTQQHYYYVAEQGAPAKTADAMHPYAAVTTNTRSGNFTSADGTGYFSLNEGAAEDDRYAYTLTTTGANRPYVQIIDRFERQAYAYDPTFTQLISGVPYDDELPVYKVVNGSYTYVGTYGIHNAEPIENLYQAELPGEPKEVGAGKYAALLDEEEPYVEDNDGVFVKNEFGKYVPAEYGTTEQKYSPKVQFFYIPYYYTPEFVKVTADITSEEIRDNCALYDSSYAVYKNAANDGEGTAGSAPNADEYYFYKTLGELQGFDLTAGNYYIVMRTGAPSDYMGSGSGVYAAVPTTPEQPGFRPAGYFKFGNYRYEGEGLGEYSLSPRTGAPDVDIFTDTIFYKLSFTNNDWFAKYVFDCSSDNTAFESVKGALRVVSKTPSELSWSDVSASRMIVFTTGVDAYGDGLNKFTSAADMDAAAQTALRNALLGSSNGNKPVVLDGFSGGTGGHSGSTASLVDDLLTKLENAKRNGIRKDVYQNIYNLTAVLDASGVLADDDFHTAFIDSAYPEESDNFIRYEDVLNQIISENLNRDYDSSIAPEDRLAEEVTKGSCIRYIISYSESALSGNELRVLEIEPGKTPDSNLLANIADWTKRSAEDIHITTYSTAEFIGRMEELSELYDLIYVGGSTVDLNTSGGETSYNDSSMNGLIYTNIGDEVKLGTGDAGNFTGLVDEDYASSSRMANRERVYRYSGNDITTIKRDQIIEFAKAGYPVIISNALAEAVDPPLANIVISVDISVQSQNGGIFTLQANAKATVTNSDGTKTETPYVRSGDTYIYPTYEWFLRRDGKQTPCGSAQTIDFTDLREGDVITCNARYQNTAEAIDRTAISNKMIVIPTAQNLQATDATDEDFATADPGFLKAYIPTVTREYTEPVNPMRTFVRVTSFTAGKNYLIVDKNSNGAAHAMTANGTGIDQTDVTVTGSNTIRTSAADAVWTTTTNGTRFNLISNKGQYLSLNSSNALQLQNGTGRTWIYSNTNLQVYNGGSRSGYLRYRNNEFTFRTNTTNGNETAVYIYEEKNPVTVTVTAGTGGTGNGTFNATTYTVGYGSDLIIPTIPNGGNTAQVSINNGSYSDVSDTTYHKLTNITANQTVRVRFNTGNTKTYVYTNSALTNGEYIIADGKTIGNSVTVLGHSSGTSQSNRSFRVGSYNDSPSITTDMSSVAWTSDGDCLKNGSYYVRDNRGKFELSTTNNNNRWDYDGSSLYRTRNGSTTDYIYNNNGTFALSTSSRNVYLFKYDNRATPADYTTHTVTASVNGDGGTISPSDNTTVADNSPIYFHIIPNSGYVIKDVSISGGSPEESIEEIKNNGFCSFENVTEDLTVEVTFASTAEAETAKYTAALTGGDSLQKTYKWFVDGTEVSNADPVLILTAGQSGATVYCEIDCENSWKSGITNLYQRGTEVSQPDHPARPLLMPAAGKIGIAVSPDTDNSEMTICKACVSGYIADELTDYQTAGGSSAQTYYNGLKLYRLSGLTETEADETITAIFGKALTDDWTACTDGTAFPVETDKTDSYILFALCDETAEQQKTLACVKWHLTCEVVNRPVDAGDPHPASLISRTTTGSININTRHLDRASNLYEAINEIKGLNSVMVAPAANSGSSYLRFCNNLFLHLEQITKPTIVWEPGGKPISYGKDQNGNLRDWYGAGTQAQQEAVLSSYSLNYTLDSNRNRIYTLVYKFSIQHENDPSADTTYDCRLYIDADHNGIFADGEQLTDIIVRQNNTVISSNLGKYKLQAGKVYEVSRQMPKDSTGVIPWKLVISKNFADGGDYVHTSATDFAYIHETGADKQPIHILQILPADVSTSANNGTGRVLNLATNPKYDKYLRAAPDFAVTVDWIMVDDFNAAAQNPNAKLADGKIRTTTKSGAGSKNFYDGTNTATTNSNVARNYSDFGGTGQGSLEEYLAKYDMLVVGFTDNYEELNMEAALRIKKFASTEHDNKPILVTHDNTSIYNLPSRSFGGVSADTYYHGYWFNAILRPLAKMDRYGVTDDAHGHFQSTTILDSIRGTATRDELLAKLGITANENWMATGRTMNQTQIDTIREDKVYDLAFTPKGDRTSTLGQTEGFSNLVLVLKKASGQKNPGKGNYSVEGGYRTTAVTQVNRGQITSYPYNVNTEEMYQNGTANFGWDSRSKLATMTVFNTHEQYYQLNLNAEDMIVWYCLADNKDTLTYDAVPNDVRNNYYLFTCGNVTYSGAGHRRGGEETTSQGDKYDNEVKLFVNTLFAAYRVNQETTRIEITGKRESNNPVQNYLAAFDVVGVGDASNSSQTVGVSSENDLYFRIHDASLNKGGAAVKFAYQYYNSSGSPIDENGNVISGNPIEFFPTIYRGSDFSEQSGKLTSNLPYYIDLKEAGGPLLMNQLANANIAYVRLWIYPADGGTADGSFVDLRRVNLFDLA